MIGLLQVDWVISGGPTLDYWTARVSDEFAMPVQLRSRNVLAVFNDVDTAKTLVVDVWTPQGWVNCLEVEKGASLLAECLRTAVIFALGYQCPQVADYDYKFVPSTAGIIPLAKSKG